MGTITGITDLDPVRWKNSQWRNLQVSTENTLVLSIKMSCTILGFVQGVNELSYLQASQILTFH